LRIRPPYDCDHSQCGPRHSKFFIDSSNCRGPYSDHQIKDYRISG
jgi:hypothetical protein